MKAFWNERYSQDEYVYGIKPNEYVKQQIKKIKPGTIFFPAEGEGRNAVYAAQLGWVVSAFDQSESAKDKAMKLAHVKKVVLDYQIHDILELDAYKNDSFDAIALVFVHLPQEIRIPFHKRLIELLKPGGTLIIEAFRQEQLEKTSGGPKLKELLMTREMLETDFSNLTIVELVEIETHLDEGAYHVGDASVIRLTGIKS
ncbi:class I SAM-dependent methyltransferase [bacterium]|nr:MAG: class I SAM-dependent methyltransferase [bacterium]